MPRGDGTGPTGTGAMTGRAAGYCNGLAAPGYMSTGRGAGSGRMRGGRGMGLFRGRSASLPLNTNITAKREELDILKFQAEDCNRTLQSIQHRIKELEAE